jgi:hypothetical protein
MKKAVCIAAVFFAAVFAVSAQRAGVIQEMAGEVELKPAGASAFAPARVGSEVAADTIVSTGFKGTAVIAVGSSTIAVKPLTRLSLSEIQLGSGTENLNLNLQAGRVRVDVKPPEGTKTNFTVQSPSATASVRGTVFEFDTLNLKVFEGTVAFLGNNSKIQMPVSAGFTTTLNKEGRAIDPTTVAKAAVQPAPPPGTNAPGRGTAASNPVEIKGGGRPDGGSGNGSGNGTGGGNSGGGDKGPSEGGIDIGITY